MYGKGTLAATGVGLTFLGYQFSLSMLAAGVVLLLVVGLWIYRAANRAKRYSPGHYNLAVGNGGASVGRNAGAQGESYAD
ncbi:hypothetical protein [Streptomyces sp. V3I7]|uniref:hypothetical protein n=1 Tax=Streptomyces sp. V3I7 TaxID=3042278 RepID=UPI00278B2878|nr:hypothetical protein [Streptomyces sp. V3I7]MDQ0991622.1 hypothetical protein [Streptomyces sp. V3I7]